MTRTDALSWLVNFLKSIGDEVGRAHAHWYGAGAGIFDAPKPFGIRKGGLDFQAVLENGISQGLISRRRTAKGRVYIKAV